MNSSVQGRLVSGCELLTSSLQLPNLKDHHVLAAAILSRADVMATSDAK